MTDTNNLNDLHISPVNVEDEMKKSYLDYAMSVIISRALPDVRDGLKPVHRRILYAMFEGGYHWNRPFRKSARIVGEVMGNYHPHGDSAIYDSMVRMAQNFSMRLPLVDGQGNFGSMDGDPPAAMRYTEARLAKVAHDLLKNIDEDTVDFQLNYDESQNEPIVLPARFPNLLVNGGGGIAVGMATNIPPHNLGELIDACYVLIDNPETTDDEIHNIVPGPDFPTGGIIIGRKGVHDACKTGRGSVIMRCRSHTEMVRKDREAIIVTEIPYQVNKSKLLEKIAELVKAKTIEGIADLRDESDKQGVRVVIELKRDASADVILNLLYRHTPLQTSFGMNMLALDHGQPKLMNIREVLLSFLKFREEVILRRSQFRLKKSREKAHTLVGLAVAIENIDEMIEMIRKAKDPQTASQSLMDKQWPIGDIKSIIKIIEADFDSEQATYQLSKEQAKAILDLKLQKLTGLERDKISSDLQILVEDIKKYLLILNSRDELLRVLKAELLEVKENFSTERKTTFEDAEFESNIEDLIQREDMVVTVTHAGYIKRVPLSTYRAQKRGGKGRSGMSTRDEDFLEKIFTVNTHTEVLFFSSYGMVYKLKTYRLPIGSPQSRGKPLVNLLPLEKDEKITTVMPLPETSEEADNLYVMFSTSSGKVRRNKLSDFTNVMANGKIAMKLLEGDRLIGVEICSEEHDVLLSTKYGKSIRFPVSSIRVFVGRASTGVRGISLAKQNKLLDEVISMCIVKHIDFDIEERNEYLKQANAIRRGDEASYDILSQERFLTLQAEEEFLLCITENGYGKRTSTYEYRVSNRGGMGIANIETSERNGYVVDSFPVFNDDQIFLVTNQGKIIRCPIHDVRIVGRKTQGVTLFKVNDEEFVVSVARIHDIEEEDESNQDEELLESSSQEDTTTEQEAG